VKLTDLRPCDGCGKPLLGEKPSHYGAFYCVRWTHAIPDQRVMRQVIGVAAITGSLRLGEALAPADEAVMLAGDKEPSLWDELLLCQECATPLFFAAERKAAFLEERQKRGVPS